MELPGCDPVTCSITNPFDFIPHMRGNLLPLVLGSYSGQPLLGIKGKSQSSNRSGAKVLYLRAPLGRCSNVGLAVNWKAETS